MDLSGSLSTPLVERVLDGLGLDGQPDVSRDGLALIYRAWCQRIPFDNVLKLIHLRSGATGPLPGDDPSAVLESWLAHGTGATCWAISGAMHALLDALGFRAHRVLATIVFGPDLPPNHGTTVVEIEDEQLLVDTSLLHGDPLVLSQDRDTAVEHPAWGLPAHFEDGRFWLTVRPLLVPNGMDCRMDLIGASRERVRERHEATRDWGPFNYALSVRTNRGDRVLGTAWGEKVEIIPQGEFRKRAFADGERASWLVEEIGFSEEIVDRLPDDLPTPPPPGTQASARKAESA